MDTKRKVSQRLLDVFNLKCSLFMPRKFDGYLAILYTFSKEVKHMEAITLLETPPQSTNGSEFLEIF